MSQRYLLIDDIRNFIPEVVAGAEVVVARDSDSALCALQENRDRGFDMIFFDHDLGENDTTRRVAVMLEEMAFNGSPYPVGTVVVHTSNSVGRSWLVASLGRSYRVRTVDALTLFSD